MYQLDSYDVIQKKTAKQKTNKIIKHENSFME